MLSRVIQTRPRDLPSQSVTVGAHEVDGSDVKPMFPTESLYATRKQPTQKFIQVWCEVRPAAPITEMADKRVFD